MKTGNRSEKNLSDVAARAASKGSIKKRIPRILTGILAIAVVISMTGVLTSPAVTMTWNEALKSGGIDVPQLHSGQSINKDINNDTSSEKFQKEAFGMPENLRIASADGNDKSGNAASTDKSAGKGDATGNTVDGKDTAGKNADNDSKAEVSKDSDAANTAGKDNDSDKNSVSRSTDTDKDGKKADANDSESDKAAGKDPADTGKDTGKDAGKDSDADKTVDNGTKDSGKDGSKDAEDSSSDDKDTKAVASAPKLLTSRTELKYEGNGYTITATVGKDAKLPENTKLEVREIVEKLDAENEKKLEKGEKTEQVTSAAADSGAEVYDKVYEDALKASNSDSEASKEGSKAAASGKSDSAQNGSDRSADSKSGSARSNDANGEAKEAKDIASETIAAQTKAKSESEFKYKNYYEEAEAAIKEDSDGKGTESGSSADPQLKFVKLYDISFVADGVEFEPSAPVDVKITYDKAIRVDKADNVKIVHFGVDKKTGEINSEILESKDTELKTEKITKGKNAGQLNMTEAGFKAESFSVYGVVYTVDFHYEINGNTYEFNLPGGGFVSLEHAVEVLGIASANENTENDTENGTAYEETIKLSEVEVSEATRQFIADVANVEFSSPELVDVSKVENENTVARIKESRELECQYSAELTEEQIAEINNSTFEAGDWALISLQPFTSEETLTVTMKNGDQFVVKVTDYQIKQTILSASGATYVITVTYGSDAQIPEGAELKVKEIASEEEEYSEAHQEIKRTLKEGKENIPSHPVLFDIAIYHEGHEIEPAEGSEVQVEVKLVGSALKGMYTDEDSPLLINDMPVTDDASQMEKQLQVLHLADEDQIDVVETKDTISEKGIKSNFTTDSFSNWLLYLDEDLTSIDVTTGDSITLRPYTEWVWKKTDEPTEPIDYTNGQWTFPTDTWDTWTSNEGGVNYRYYRHKTNGSVFRSFSKTDDQLHETYTVVTSQSLSATNGGFDLTTNKGKTIHVNVTQGASSGKPGTVPGISGLKVNLYDYDVPYQKDQNGQNINNTFDFTQSGDLDVQSNVASNPNNNNNINTNHDLKFIGYGGSNSNNYGGINNYTNENPHQNIVKDELGSNGYPVLNNGSNQNLSYLFNTESKNHNVYAFPEADGLFQLDNMGYYYYNSNANYAEYDRTNNKFILYEHTYSQNTGGSNGANAKPIGFFPFHEFDTVDTQPSMNFNGNLNHHFGMSMEVDFEIPKDRKASDPSGYKHDIIYEFSGDDDLWVFVDDELVLDIGGIHQPVTGTINFTTGVISVHGVADKTMTFDVGNHTLKMFYMERGGCDSNLSVRFNLPLIIGQGNVTIVKKSQTTDATNPDIPLEGAVFGIWDNPDCEGDPYTVATSDRNGIVFKNLPIREEGQKYYLREISPPEGYILDRTIFTLTTGDKDANGDYTFIISNGDEVISENDPTLGYPILRNQHNAPIGIAVHKAWENADGTEMEEVPEGLTAKFAVKRKRTYSTDPLLTINLVSSNSRIGRFDTISAHAGDILTIRYQHARDGSTTAQCSTANGVQNVLALPTNSSGDPISVTYTVNEAHASNDIIDIIIPSWFTDWCNGANYDAGFNPTFENIQSVSHNSVTEDDPDYEQEITLTAEGGWTGSVNGLAVQEKKNGIIYHYEYYIVEKDIPDGFEAIFYDSNGNPVSDPSSQATNTGGTQEVVNRELLDVPIEKNWADFSGETYTWTATFQLEEMEIKVNEGDPNAPAAEVKDEFTPIPGKILTISKGQTPVPTFNDLPMYRVHSNGTVYRIQYSVSEIGYTVERNGTIVAQWGVDANGDELEIIGDTRYEPQFEQDAGEHGSAIDDYKIKIVNMMETRILDKEIDLTVQKTWPEGSSYANSGETYASFVLKRYVHQEYRDYSKVAAGTEWKTITLKTWQNDETKDQTVTVPVNTVVHITGSIKPSTNANRIRFTQSSGQEDLILVKNNEESDPYPFDITVTADQDKTIHLAQGDNYVIGGRDGFRLSDTYGNKTPDLPDSTFEEAFTLNKANNWTTAFEYLPQIEEQDIDPTTGSQTIFVFTYYLEETGCNPSDFYPVFTDDSELVVGGNINSRIDYSTTLTAENKRKTTDITLKKVAKDQLDAEDPPTLKKAAFRIEKYTSNTFQQKDDSWGTDGEMVLTDINDNGVFSLEGLSTGFYKIVETAFPDGYVKLSEDPIFEVRFNNTTKELEVVLLNADATEATNNHTEMVRVNDMTILFGNTPGTPLPNSGGPGTTWIYLLGAILFVGSTIALASRRRTRRYS